MVAPMLAVTFKLAATNLPSRCALWILLLLLYGVGHCSVIVLDSYAEIGAGADGIILSTARETLKGCCAACAVPVGAFKAMQVAAGVALPKDVTLKIDSE
ncbi:MAG: hypothetical protein WC381_03995 [Kiritimatiellia bacterium]